MPARKQKEFTKDVLQTVCHLLATHGLSRGQVESTLTGALDQVFETSLAPGLGVRQISRLADVCARWFFDEDFVDDKGIPRPLKWNGRTGSLRKLVIRVVGQESAKQVIEELIARDLLRKVGKDVWEPKSQVVAPHGFDSAQELRRAQMVGRLLRTISHNRSLHYKGEVLLEVMAQVPRLPSKDLANFRKFTKAQGLSFIKAVDDWLESRNLLRGARAKTREAGVVAFAFVEPSRRPPKR